FEAVRVADGFIRHGDLFADLLAHLDEATGLWFNYHDLRLYLAAVVRAVQGELAGGRHHVLRRDWFVVTAFIRSSAPGPHECVPYEPRHSCGLLRPDRMNAVTTNLGHYEPRVVHFLSTHGGQAHSLRHVRWCSPA